MEEEKLPSQESTTKMAERLKSINSTGRSREEAIVGAKRLLDNFVNNRAEVRRIWLERRRESSSTFRLLSNFVGFLLAISIPTIIYFGIADPDSPVWVYGQFWVYLWAFIGVLAGAAPL